jgi:hypothetical protein
MVTGISLILACNGGDTTGVKNTTTVSCGSGATPVSLSKGAYTSLDPTQGSACASFPANASTTDSAEYLLVPQSAAGTSGQNSPFLLQATSATATSPIEPSASVPTIAQSFDRFLRWTGRTRTYPTSHSGSANLTPGAASSPGGARVPPTMGSLRDFKVCGDRSCSGLKSVTGRVQAVGAHVAIYQDTLAPSSGGLVTADFDTLKQVFDTRLYPIDSAAFGPVSDIDGNSVVIVLMTNAVNTLVTASQCQSGGFPAGFFYPGDLDPTVSQQYNHGEVFYTIVADSNSTLSCPHTRTDIKQLAPTSFAHEFEHMINFVQHVVVRSGQTEEGWLDEGLAKYAEELAGRSYLTSGDQATFNRYTLNDLLDAYHYLAAPGNFVVLFPHDDAGSGNNGACWLFVRYLADQFGPGITLKLVETASMGAANVATQTSLSFATLVSRWALANWVSDLPGFTPPSELQYTSWSFRTTFPSLNSQYPGSFPAPFPLVPTMSAASAVNLSGTLNSGTGLYHRALQAPGAAAFRLLFSTDGSTPLPASVVPRLTVIRIR